MTNPTLLGNDRTEHLQSPYPFYGGGRVPASGLLPILCPTQASIHTAKQGHFLQQAKMSLLESPEGHLLCSALCEARGP